MYQSIRDYDCLSNRLPNLFTLYTQIHLLYKYKLYIVFLNVSYNSMEHFRFSDNVSATSKHNRSTLSSEYYFHPIRCQNM